jgi:hypothetical protein
VEEVEGVSVTVVASEVETVAVGEVVEVDVEVVVVSLPWHGSCD